MKKILSLFIICLFFISGCNDYRKMTPEEIAERDRNAILLKRNECLNNLKNHIEIMDWNGHSYVVYHKKGHTYMDVINLVSITHNPDCTCLKK